MFKKSAFTIFSAIILLGLTAPLQLAVFAQDTPSSTITVPVDTTTSDNLNSPDFMFDVGIITHEDIDTQGWIRGGINFVFERLIGIMAGTIGSVAVLIMVLGGFRMIIYAGNSDEFEKAKAMLTKAAIGLVLVLGAYIMVTAVQLLIKGIYA